MVHLSLCTSLTDCLELDEEFRDQPKRLSALAKRTITTQFVSPIRSKLNLSSSPATSSCLFVGTSTATQLTKQPRCSPVSLVCFPSSSPPRPQCKCKKSRACLLSSSPPQSKRKHKDAACSDGNKIWPDDYQAYEIHNGLIQMDKTINHQLPGTGRKATIEDAFLAAFPKTKKYPHSTFYKYRGIWKNSDSKVRLVFIDLVTVRKPLLATSWLHSMTHISFPMRTSRAIHHRLTQKKGPRLIPTDHPQLDAISCKTMIATLSRNGQCLLIWTYCRMASLTCRI